VRIWSTNSGTARSDHPGLLNQVQHLGGSRSMPNAKQDGATLDASGVRRHLILVRHAKSAWNDPSLADHDRPLAPRGARALPRLSNHLASVPPPELVLCSTSRRTADTLEGIRAALPRDARIEMEQALYEATADTLLGRLQRVDSDIGCAMVIGHNPAVQDLAMLLVNAGDPDMRAQLSAKLPTAAAVTLSLDGAWADLGAGTVRLDDLFMPRPRGS
jgi:phosphohistidine phosphatase